MVYVLVYNFICVFSHGFAGLRTSGNANQFKKPLVVAYYAVDYVKNPKGTNYWRNRWATYLLPLLAQVEVIYGLTCW